MIFNSPVWIADRLVTLLTLHKFEKMGKQVRVRFAPSPTGPLHIGGVRTALFNYLFARKNNGKLILRIEDTDQNRYVPGAEAYIRESLRWCGISFDEGPEEGGPFVPYRQSERKDLYRKFADQLIESGHAYYAWDTSEELDKARSLSERHGASFLYNASTRTNMQNSISQGVEAAEKIIGKGMPYVIRYRTEPGNSVAMNDLIRGVITVQTENLDDKVLLKADGMPTYHLANVVDDHLMQISHVIRGEEWLPSLPLHVLLYQAFGWEEEMPEFAHLPLILKPEGKGKLSKRDGDRMGFPVFPINWNAPEGEVYSGYREAGYLPEALVNILALLGWNPGTEQEIYTMEELIEQFSLEQVGKAGARFDPQKARWFNHQHLQKKDINALADYVLKEFASKGIRPDAGKVVKAVALILERVDLLPDLIKETEYFFVAPVSYDEKTVRKKWNSELATTLKELVEVVGDIDDFSSSVTEELIKQWIEHKGLKTGSVLSGLRLLLVGGPKGPHLFDIMEVLGKEEVIKRIRTGLEQLYSGT